METDNSKNAIERKLLKSPKSTPWAHYVITKLIEFQTKTKMIARIIANYDVHITEQDIGRLYKEKHGKASSRGQDIFNPERLIHSTERTFHASIYYALYKDYSRLYPDKPMALIEAYNEYLRLFQTDVESAVLSFTYAYTTVQFFGMNKFVYVRCFQCKLHFVHLPNTPLSNSSCPSCAILKKNTKVSLAVVPTKSAIKL